MKALHLSTGHAFLCPTAMENTMSDIQFIDTHKSIHGSHHVATCPFVSIYTKGPFQYLVANHRTWHSTNPFDLRGDTLVLSTWAVGPTLNPDQARRLEEEGELVITNNYGWDHHYKVVDLQEGLRLLPEMLKATAEAKRKDQALMEKQMEDRIAKEKAL